MSAGRIRKALGSGPSIQTGRHVLKKETGKYAGFFDKTFKQKTINKRVKGAHRKKSSTRRYLNKLAKKHGVFT